MWTPEDQRLYNVAYYAEHRDEEIERVKVRQAATLEFLRDLRRRPCADCGRSFPPWVMDFDHRDPKTKSFALAAGHALLKSREVLLAEIAKCDIVCANCHAVRTYNWIKSEDVFASRAPGVSRHLARQTAYRAAQSKLLAALRTVPCLDCGGTFPFFVMQFDHRDPPEKKYLVSQMVGRAGTETILAEVAKCDIVCTNCHRERTYRRRCAR
ncbi:MAG: hypothetical protein AABM40_06775 [Chloroflexota bacterium]